MTCPTSHRGSTKVELNTDKLSLLYCLPAKDDGEEILLSQALENYKDMSHSM